MLGSLKKTLLSEVLARAFFFGKGKHVFIQVKDNNIKDNSSHWHQLAKEVKDTDAIQAWAFGSQQLLA